MKMIDLSHPMSVHTPGWVGYASNKMYYAQNLQTVSIVAQRIDTALHVGTHIDGALHATDGREGDMASYPLEYLRSSADLEPLKHAALVSGGSDQAKPAQIWDAAGEKVSYTQDLWPYVLIAVAILFLLDLYAKRVRLFGYRTIKFQ